MHAMQSKKTHIVLRTRTSADSVGRLTCPCRKPYPAWQSIENRTMIACNEGSLQAHWLDGCGSDPVAGNA